MMLVFEVFVDWIECLMYGRTGAHSRRCPSLDDDADLHPHFRERR